MYCLVLALIFCLFSGCDLMSNMPENDLEQKIDSNIEYQLAAPTNLHIGSIPGSVNTITPDADVAKQKQGYSFEVYFTANPAWAFTGWEAVFSSGAAAGSKYIKFEEKKDSKGKKTGVATVTVYTGTGLTLIPRCVERPYVTTSNMPGNITERKFTNYPIHIWFNREIDPLCLTFDNFIISAKTRQGSGETIEPEVMEAKAYFNPPAMNGGQVTISRTAATVSDPEFINLNITVKLNMGGIYANDKNNKIFMGDEGQYKEFYYAVHTDVYDTKPEIEGLAAAASANNDLIPGGNNTVDHSQLKYYAREENGERVVYLLFDSAALDASIDQQLTYLTNVRITEKREGGTYNSENNYPYTLYGLYPAGSHPNAPSELTDKYKAAYSGKTPYIVRHVLKTRQDGVIQLAVQPTDILENRDNFDEAQKVKIILDTTPPGQVENITPVYNAAGEFLDLTWENPDDPGFNGITLTAGEKPPEELLKTAESKRFTGITSDKSYTFSFVTHDYTGNTSAPKTFVLRHAEKPVIRAQPPDKTIAQYSTTELTVSAGATDGGTLSYQWYKNSVAEENKVGTNSSRYSPSVSMSGDYYYCVVVTNTNNNVHGVKTAAQTSRTAKLTVTPLPDNTSITVNVEGMDEWDLMNQTRTVTADTPTQISVAGSYKTYKWYLDGVIIPGAAGRTLTFNQSEGVYELVAVVTNSQDEERSGRCYITAEP